MNYIKYLLCKHVSFSYMDKQNYILDSIEYYNGFLTFRLSHSLYQKILNRLFNRDSSSGIGIPLLEDNIIFSVSGTNYKSFGINTCNALVLENGNQKDILIQSYNPNAIKKINIELTKIHNLANSNVSKLEYFTYMKDILK